MTQRPKLCRHCRSEFTPMRPMQKACSPTCALELARAVRLKAERKEDRVKREKLKSIRQLLSEAQRVFNSWTRERDKRLPCISCGRFHQGAWDAGHYMTTGARPGLRFDESNVHRQCVPCNQHLSGNLVAYRVGLIARVGLAEVERLEGPSAPHKWTREEIAAIKAKYSAKRRELEKETA